MEKRRKHILAWGILLCMMAGTIVFWYGDILSSPNDYLFHKYGDGLKNYYTPWYHVKHDSSFTWFEGMNYPYGEHVVFADAQPLVTNTIKVISETVTDLSDHTIGILNMLMLLNPLLTAIFLFLIMRRFGVTAWFAAFAAASIALMSPQLIRTSAHYALAYSFFIPMFWYMAIRVWEKRNWKWTLILAGTLFLSAWVHPYYLMIGATFLAFAWGVKWLFYGDKRSFLIELAHFGVQILLPVLLFKLILGWTDPIGDRPSSPYGFEEFYATWRTLLLPYPIPGMTWTNAWKTAQEVSWEGVAYVGVLGSFTLFFFVGRVVRRLLRKRPGRKKILGKLRVAMTPSTQKIITISALAGLAIAIFACGFPFAIKPDRLTELFPPIKQFRSLGRFAWAFYYTWTVFGFYTIYLLWKRFSQRGNGWIGYLLLLPGLIFFAESFAYQYPVRKKIMLGNAPEMALTDAENPVSRLLSKVNTADYDALLVLPYFHIGSENLYAYDSLAVQVAFPAAMQSGLPLMNVMMSRGSLDQAWKQLQFVSERNFPAEIVADLPANARILVLNLQHRKSPYDGGDIQSTGLIASNYRMDLMAIDLGHPDKNRYYIRNLTDRRPVPSMEPVDTVQPTSEPLVFQESFDSGDKPGYVGKAQSFRRDENNFIYDGVPDALAGDTLIASIWVKMREDQLPLTYFGFEEKTASGEQVRWTYKSFTDYTVRFEGEWALCEKEFILHETGNQIRINITRWKKSPPEIIVDEFLIYRKGRYAVESRHGKQLINNRLTEALTIEQ